MHHKPPTIELPERMEILRERATRRNESLIMLLRRINEEQLTVGRLGLLIDIEEFEGTAQPYIATYCTEDIVNWHEQDDNTDTVSEQKLRMVVLRETANKLQDDLSWKEEAAFVLKWRSLCFSVCDCAQIASWLLYLRVLPGPPANTRTRRQTTPHPKPLPC